MMKLFIKNMVCPRCIMAVEQILSRLAIPYASVELGKVVLDEAISKEKEEELAKELQSIGFEWIDEKKDRLTEQIKVAILKIIYDEIELKVNLSDYLSDILHLDYTYISNQFSESEGTTIEKFFIAQKIERVKELLAYNELSLSEISMRLNYSSVAHLSAQFKKVAGITPSQYRQSDELTRKTIDRL